MLANVHAQGLSGARRSGAERSHGEVLAFIDDDAIADPDWLRHLASPYEDPDVLGVGGLIEPLWERPAPSWWPAEFNWVVGCTYAGMPVARHRIRNPIGANMSVRADVLERAGAFDPRLGRKPGGTLVAGAAEETEFCIRASRLHPGQYWIYEPQARVRHAVPPERATWRYFVHRCVVEGTAKALLARFAGADAGLESERALRALGPPRRGPARAARGPARAARGICACRRDRRRVRDHRGRVRSNDGPAARHGRQRRIQRDRHALANPAPLCQNAAAATPSPGERKESQVPGTTNLIRARK